MAVPAAQHSARELLQAIGDEWPGYLGYIVSFATVGALWLGHHAITDYLDRADTTLLRLNLLLLLFVSFLPFPTRMLSEYVTTDQVERVAVTFYGLTLLIDAALLSLLWRYALHARLVRPNAGDEEITLLIRRVFRRVWAHWGTWTGTITVALLVHSCSVTMMQTVQVPC